jgi:hypothetical protein
MAQWRYPPSSLPWCSFRGMLIPAGGSAGANMQLVRKGWTHIACPVCGRRLRARPGMPVQRHRRLEARHLREVEPRARESRAD